MVMCTKGTIKLTFYAVSVNDNSKDILNSNLKGVQRPACFARSQRPALHSFRSN